MTKAKVKMPFADKYNDKILYKVGSVVEFDDDRAADCAERGLVEIIKQPKPKATAEKKATKKTEKTEKEEK